MPIPIIVAAFAVAAAAALVYFFTSNRAGQNRTEYERKVQSVLDLITEKVRCLKERLEKSEAEIRDLKEENKALRQKEAKYKAELEKAEHEKAVLEAELSRWKNVPGSVVGRMEVLGYSQVLLQAKFSPAKAMANLERRRLALEKEIKSLVSAD